MKKILLLTIFAYFISLGLYAQSLKLSNSYGAVNNGDTIVMASTDVDHIFAIYIDVKNEGSNLIYVKAKKTEVSIMPGTENYFCWGSCYDPSVYVSIDSISMGHNDVNKTFSGDYETNKITGASIIMYTFFDSNDPNDSIAFIVKYITGSGVGIEGSKPEVNISNIFPNPAKNNVSISYDLNGATNARVEIRNILGSIVRVQEINESNGQINMDVSDLTNGVYFYSFIVNEMPIKATKLVIQH